MGVVRHHEASARPPAAHVCCSVGLSSAPSFPFPLPISGSALFLICVLPPVARLSWFARFLLIPSAAAPSVSRPCLLSCKARPFDGAALGGCPPRPALSPVPAFHLHPVLTSHFPLCSHPAPLSVICELTSQRRFTGRALTGLRCCKILCAARVSHGQLTAVSPSETCRCHTNGKRPESVSSMEDLLSSALGVH